MGDSECLGDGITVTRDSATRLLSHNSMSYCEDDRSGIVLLRNSINNVY